MHLCIKRIPNVVSRRTENTTTNTILYILLRNILLIHERWNGPDVNMNYFAQDTQSFVVAEKKKKKKSLRDSVTI